MSTKHAPPSLVVADPDFTHRAFPTDQFGEDPSDILVTKAYLPDPKRIQHYLDSACRSRRLSNRGPLEYLLTHRLKDFLGVENLLLVSNGTLALQLAQAALGVKFPGASAVTTPFSFVATASSLLWEGVTPRFSDIDSESLCMDPSLIPGCVDESTRVIVPVHVYGNVCDTDAIERIAERYGLKTIYDGSHAFGVRYRGRSVLEQGDASTLSFHATKLFHCVEGGAIVFDDADRYEAARDMSNFGYHSGNIGGPGINAKLSEIHAAFGLAVLEDITIIREKREIVWHRYREALEEHVTMPRFNEEASANHAYFPVVLDSEITMHRVKNQCESAGIHPRRYFHPSLNTLEHMPDRRHCPVSEDVTSRILCLPCTRSSERSSRKG